MFEIGLVLLTLFAIAFVSAFVPVLPTEAAMIGAVVAAGTPLWVLALFAATGQMLGKLIFYWLGTGNLSKVWLVKRIKKENNKKTSRWVKYIQAHPNQSSLITLVSAFSGLPPFAIISVLAGKTKMNLYVFFGTGLLGRYGRFVLAGAFPAAFLH